MVRRQQMVLLIQFLVCILMQMQIDTDWCWLVLIDADWPMSLGRAFLDYLQYTGCILRQQYIKIDYLAGPRNLGGPVFYHIFVCTCLKIRFGSTTKIVAEWKSTNFPGSVCGGGGGQEAWLKQACTILNQGPTKLACVDWPWRAFCPGLGSGLYYHHRVQFCTLSV